MVPGTMGTLPLRPGQRHGKEVDLTALTFLSKVGK